MGPSGQRRYDRGPCSVYDPLFESGLFETGPLEVPVDHTALQLKRRRLEGLRLSDVSGGGHYELGLQATLQPRHMDYRFLEEENALLRRRVEELKKQVIVLEFSLKLYITFLLDHVISTCLFSC